MCPIFRCCVKGQSCDLVRCFKSEGKLQVPWVVFWCQQCWIGYIVMSFESTDGNEERNSLPMQGPSDSVPRDVRISFRIRKIPEFTSKDPISFRYLTRQPSTQAWYLYIVITIDNQQDATVLIYLILITSTCFGWCFRPSSGAYYC